MKKNVGTIDRVLRIVAGVGLIGWGIYAKNWWGALGIVPLATALIRYCPGYTLFGCTTMCSTSSAGATPNPGEHQHGQGCCH